MKYIAKYESTNTICISAFYLLGTLSVTTEILFNSSFGQETHWYNYN